MLRAVKCYSTYALYDVEINEEDGKADYASLETEPMSLEEFTKQYGEYLEKYPLLYYYHMDFVETEPYLETYER